MCLCGTDVQYSYFVSPDRYQYRLQLMTDSKFCMQLGTPISMPIARTPFIGRLYLIYQSIGQIISFQMMPLLRSFDDLDGKERGQKKTDDLDPRMRKCEEHLTLVHLDVHVYPVFVCVCVCVCMGGTLIYI